MPAQPEYVEFSPDAPADVLRHMRLIADDHNGWINFEPAVYVEDAPPPKGGLFSLFSTRGPDVPVATWHPGEVTKRRTEPAQVGILHAAGVHAKTKLDERGHAVPEGWVVTQDYSKKGFVVAVPPSVSHAEVLDWLLPAAASLSTVPLTGRWRAVVYVP